MSDNRFERLLSGLPTELFLGGRWCASVSGDRLEVVNPATGEPIAEVASAGPDDGTLALDSAVSAAGGWARTPGRLRAEILRRAFDLINAEAENIALLITLEMGKPLAESRREVAYGAEYLRWFSEEAARIQGRYGPTPEGDGRMIVTQHPVGPCFLITPWNFPLAMATRKIAPALAAGCTVVIKPAAQTPLTTLYLARLLEQAGAPEGVVNVVTTSTRGAAAVSTPVITDPRLRKLSFTGSTRVGQILLGQAANGVLRTSMELGGNAPFIVFDDADLESSIEGAMTAKFRNMGQACTAANRVIVHRSIAAEFTSGVIDRVRALRVGPGTDPIVTIGPVIDEAAIVKVHALVTDAVERGAVVEVGGRRIGTSGTFYEPTVLTNVAEHSRVLREEIFGPVLAIVPFDTEEEAVAMANETEYGLVSYVFTQDLSRVQRMIDVLQTGMMGLNVAMVSNAAAPFGGWKMSGLGREGGPEGIIEYLQSKYTLTASPDM